MCFYEPSAPDSDGSLRDYADLAGFPRLRRMPGFGCCRLCIAVRDHQDLELLHPRDVAVVYHQVLVAEVVPVR